PAILGLWHSHPCRSDRDFVAPLLIVPSGGTWRKALPDAGAASNVTTGLQQSRRWSAIHRAHPIPTSYRRQGLFRGNSRRVSLVELTAAPRRSQTTSGPRPQTECADVGQVILAHRYM